MYAVILFRIDIIRILCSVYHFIDFVIGDEIKYIRLHRVHRTSYMHIILCFTWAQPVKEYTFTHIEDKNAAGIQFDSHILCSMYL